MQARLELDGYVYREGVLWVPEQGVVDEAEEEGVLVGLMTTTGLADVATLKHHLQLSGEHYEQSRWDDCISSSRKVLEGVLEQVAQKTGLPVPSPLTEGPWAGPAKVRDHLERVGLLERKEKETLSQVYGLLSATGAHPFMAERDHARLMRYLALTFAQFVLLRLEGSTAANVSS